MSGQDKFDFNVFIYIYRGFSRKKLRNTLTVAGLSLTLTFLILVLSMARGFMLETEESLKSGPSGEDDHTPPDPGEQTKDRMRIDRDVQQTIITWLVITSFFTVIATASIISNTVIISIIERRREIGILKSLGLTDGQVARVFVIESLWLAVLSWLIALFAGTFLSGNVFNSLYERGASPLFFSPARAMPEILGLVFLVTMLLTVASSVFPALRASRLNPVDAMNPE